MTVWYAVHRGGRTGVMVSLAFPSREAAEAARATDPTFLGTICSAWLQSLLPDALKETGDV